MLSDDDSCVTSSAAMEQEREKFKDICGKSEGVQTKPRHFPPRSAVLSGGKCRTFEQKMPWFATRLSDARRGFVSSPGKISLRFFPMHSALFAEIPNVYWAFSSEEGKWNAA